MEIWAFVLGTVLVLGEGPKMENPEIIPLNQLEMIEATVYAYSPSVAETDSTPFLNASGERVREGTIANNCLPLHSKVILNGKIYEVKDRMNSRYTCNVFDVFKWSRSDALAWGK